MDEKKELSPAEMENELNRCRLMATIGKILIFTGIACFVIVAFLYGLWIALLCLIPAAFGLLMRDQNEKSIKDILSNNIVSSVLNEVFDSVMYKPFDHLPDETVRDSCMLFPFDYSRIKGSDYIQAEYKGIHIEMSDVELYHVDSEWNQDTGQTRENEKLNFKGQWLVCNFGKRLSNDILISENTKDFRKQYKKNEFVQMENEAFNKRFKVTCYNPQEAYYVLTPHMMEYILTAVEKSGGEVYMTFTRAGRLYIAVKTGKDFFELGTSNANVQLLHDKFLGQLHWFTDIVDELRIENTMF